jgi:hypothetical protein
MPPKRDYEEEKVQQALDLLEKNPGMKRAQAYRVIRAYLMIV